jgi:hypothetical protein
MTNDYELADDSRESLIWTKEQLLAPVEPDMETPPHPMRLGASERDYYLLGSPNKVATAGTAEPAASGADTSEGWAGVPSRDELAAAAGETPDAQAARPGETPDAQAARPGDGQDDRDDRAGEQR